MGTVRRSTSGGDVATTTQTQGWARFAAAIADQVITATVQDVHRAVADSGFRWVGPLGRPVRRVHDTIADTTYDLVQSGLRGLGGLGAAALGARPSTRSPRSGGRAGAIAVGAVDADLLVDAAPLDVDMGLFTADGAPVAVDAQALRDAHPDASDHVVVFVHGLVDDESAWRTPDPADGARSDHQLLPDLARDSGATAVLVRYGTGRPVARNGIDLANVLEPLTRSWPVPVARLTLVGHSMGGLVIRAACQVAGEQGHAWTNPLRDVVYLGTPHLGAWLEKVAVGVTRTLQWASPHSAPFGTLLDWRSRGIKDLRYGSVVDDADDAALTDTGLTGPAASDPPWREGVTHHLVVGRLRDRPGHPLNAVFGDTMVHRASASGTSRRRRIPDGGPVMVTEVSSSHNRLATDPDVAILLAAILDQAPAARPPAQ